VLFFPVSRVLIRSLADAEERSGRAQVSLAKSEIANEEGRARGSVFGKILVGGRFLRAAHQGENHWHSVCRGGRLLAWRATLRARRKLATWAQFGAADRLGGGRLALDDAKLDCALPADAQVLVRQTAVGELMTRFFRPSRASRTSHRRFSQHDEIAVPVLTTGGKSQRFTPRFIVSRCIKVNFKRRELQRSRAGTSSLMQGCGLGPWSPGSIVAFVCRGGVGFAPSKARPLPLPGLEPHQLEPLPAPPFCLGRPEFHCSFTARSVQLSSRAGRAVGACRASAVGNVALHTPLIAKERKQGEHIRWTVRGRMAWRAGGHAGGACKECWPTYGRRRYMYHDLYSVRRQPSQCESYIHPPHGFMPNHKSQFNPRRAWHDVAWHDVAVGRGARGAAGVSGLGLLLRERGPSGRALSGGASERCCSLG
jgi:hypothetical protein